MKLLLSVVLCVLFGIGTCDDSCNQFTAQDALIVIDVQNDFMQSVELDDQSKSPQYTVPNSDILTVNGKRFTKNGAIAVQNTDEIISPINSWLSHFNSNNFPTFLSLDWHPKGHCSFCRNGTADTNPSGFRPSGGICGPIGPTGVPANFNSTGRCVDIVSTTDFLRGKMFQWPDHCIGGDSGFGVRFSPFLEVPSTAQVVMKGFENIQDSYSAWHGTLTASAWPFWNSTESADDLRDRPSLALMVAQRNIRRVFVTGIATDFCVMNTALDALGQRFGDVVVVGSAVRGVSVQGVAAAEAAIRKRGGFVTPTDVVSPQDVLNNFCQQKQNDDNDGGDDNDGSSSNKSTVVALAVLTTIFGVSSIVLAVLLMRQNKAERSVVLTDYSRA